MGVHCWNFADTVDLVMPGLRVGWRGMEIV